MSSLCTAMRCLIAIIAICLAPALPAATSIALLPRDIHLSAVVEGTAGLEGRFSEVPVSGQRFSRARRIEATVFDDPRSIHLRLIAPIGPVSQGDLVQFSLWLRCESPAPGKADLLWETLPAYQSLSIQQLRDLGPAWRQFNISIIIEQDRPRSRFMIGVGHQAQTIDIGQITCTRRPGKPKGKAKLATAQEVARTVRIRHRASGRYLGDAGEHAALGDGENRLFRWYRIAVDMDFLQLRNLATGDLLHVEDDHPQVQCDRTEAGWSSHWVTEADGSGGIRLRNRWKDDHFLRCVPGSDASAHHPIGDDASTQRWELVP